VETASDVALAHWTTLRVGGPAREFHTVTTEAELVDAVRAADAAGVPTLLLGGGSNLLVADEGFPGRVIRIAVRGIEGAEVCGAGRVRAAAGEAWDPFVAQMVAQGYAGVEALSGIPGSVGATPIQNVGAYGQEVAQTIASVRVLDRRTGEVRELPAQECGFGYRSSRFKADPERYVVLAVTFELARTGASRPIRYAELARALQAGIGDTAPLEEVRQTVLRLRRGKGMVLDPADHDTWSAGSFFTNPVVPDAAALPADAPAFPAEGGVKTSAAWLIEQAGFGKGYGAGRPATLSTKHTLALTNRGSASATDLLALAREIRDGVHDRFGIVLVPEPVLVGCTLEG
jgi:UDP-N-acetylmuramate dehydrogenase